MYRPDSRLNKKMIAIFAPLLDFLYQRLRLTPNTLSVVGFIFGFLSALTLAGRRLYLSALLLVIAMLFDALDGMLARHANLATAFGKKLDMALDRSSEALLFCAAAYAGLASWRIVILAIVAILLLTSIEGKSHFDPGFKRTILFLGYFLNNFSLALYIIFGVNLLGFIAGLLIVEFRRQEQEDKNP